jgi:hypothetical protein
LALPSWQSRNSKSRGGIAWDAWGVPRIVRLEKRAIASAL